MPMNKKAISLACNAFLAIMEPLTWGMMLFSRSELALTAIGLMSLKYFTVLSNLLLGAASLVYGIFLFRTMRSGVQIPVWAHRLKYVATVSVTVTLMTVLLFLGPMLGYIAMFSGVNFWFHLVLPVVGIFDFALLDANKPLAFKETLLGVVPTFLYGIGYCANILLNGVGKWPNTNDWYGFTMWGVEYMPVVLLVMLLATWLFAIALRAANSRFAR